MSEYNPDKWLMIRINGTDPHYRIFGSWFGGFLDGDAWRLNSGVKSVTEDDDYYYFNGNSGSVYKCFKEAYGANSFGWSNAQHICKETNSFLLDEDESKKIIKEMLDSKEVK